MPGYLRIQAESRNGLCVLRVSGDVDIVTAGKFAERADQALRAVPGSAVVVDLAGLTFIDARGARALVAAIDALPAGRLTAVRSCPAHVRLVLDLLDLSLNYLPPGLPAESRAAPRSGTRELMGRVQDALLHATVAKRQASDVLATLADTSIRLASTLENTERIREQGRRVLAGSRAAREDALRSRPGAVKDAEVRLREPALLGKSLAWGYPVDLAVHGPDSDKVREFARKLGQRLRQAVRRLEQDERRVDPRQALELGSPRCALHRQEPGEKEPVATLMP